jgi:hypothetical protein
MRSFSTDRASSSRVHPTLVEGPLALPALASLVTGLSPYVIRRLWLHGHVRSAHVGGRLYLRLGDCQRHSRPRWSIDGKGATR